MPGYNYSGAKDKKTAYFSDGSKKVYSQNQDGNMHGAGQKAIKKKGSGKSLGNIPKKDRTKVN